MLRCPYCGHSNPVGVRFCEKCRADLRGIQATISPSARSGEFDPNGTVFSSEPSQPTSNKGEPILPSTVHLKQVPMIEMTNLELSEPPAPLPSQPADPPVTPVLPPSSVPKANPQAGPPTNPISKRATEAPTRLGRHKAKAEPQLPPHAQTQLPPHAQTQLPPHAQTHLGPVSPGQSTQASPDTRPKLVVIRGLKLNVVYPIYEGRNYIGRPDERPVDIDLVDQESSDRVWASRQHAVIIYENGVLSIEDLNSLNGTFVNRVRVPPGQLRVLQINDVVQIGTVHMKVTM